MKNYSKPWKSYEEQLNLLIKRGLTVTDHTKALKCLQWIGYYRLSGYWYPFRQRSGELVLLSPNGRKPKRHHHTETIATDSFKSGATFENAVRLYVFDKRLRLLLLDALERIEIALRADLSHTLGRHDRFAYQNPDYFHPKFSKQLNPKTSSTDHRTWLSKHKQLISRSKETFVLHNKDKYGLPLAIWVACEVWDFGALSKLYSGMQEKDQDAVSTRYGIHNGRIFATWLRSLNYLRNICAHHSRLWNRNIIDQPKLPTPSEVAWVDQFDNNGHLRARCFLLLRITRHLLRIINPNSSWSNRIKKHLEDFPNLNHLDLSLTDMGVPEGWKTRW